MKGNQNNEKMKVSVMSMDINHFEDDFIKEENLFNSSPLNFERRKSKALTVESKKNSISYLVEEFNEEVLYNQQIYSTKRRYTLDEMSMSMSMSGSYHNDIFEIKPAIAMEESKNSKIFDFKEIKRNDVKKKKFVQSELPSKMKEDVPVIQRVMSIETMNMITKTLQSHFLFSNMDMIQMYFSLLFFFYPLKVKALLTRCSFVKRRRINIFSSKEILLLLFS